MKILNTILFFLLGFVSLHAQDTTVVQTFTWESDTRADFFTFPDDPTQSYRKILMVYNMRCHDDQVGNGGVGCREWDYSCNTFLTDPSRVDSTRQTHPTHVVSNFSGNSFDYSDNPTYTYYVYDQHQTTLTENDVTESIVGNGDLEMPLSSLQEVTRAQFLMTASELQTTGMTAGAIHALKMDLSSLGDAINFLKIKIQATDLTELDPNNPLETGFQEVYFQNTAFDAIGWKDFNFYEAFTWDGEQNLVVEFSFTTEVGDNGVTVKGTDTGYNSAIFTGSSDHALFFAGSGTVDVPVNDFGSISEEITISLWQFGDPEIMPANSYIFEGVDGDNNRQANVHLPWSNGQVYWDCGNDGGGYDRINAPANTQDFEGQWNHWAFTKNAATGVMKIFLNGEEWLSGTGKTKPIDLAQFQIGSSANLSGRYWGSIDEFRIWNKALNEATIQEWMRKPLDNDHPNTDNLVAYYPMNEGEGFVLNDASPNAVTADIQLPNWQRIRGEELYKDFTGSTIRPNFAFVQGDVTVSDEIISVMDSVINPLHQITAYEVVGTDLKEVETTFSYPAGQMYIFNEAGEIVDSIFVAASGNIQIGTLTHYAKADAKYELLSLVTPYGNGLDLGPDGKTFTFDVTDFAPILKGEKYISIEMGGQWQEELDIKFLFIEGTPPREVMNIQQIWPFRRGWFDQIQNDQFFEPRALELSADGSHFELHSAITGHGQNGEFVSRNHYLNVNGGAQDFTYDVWKYCGKNPIYPQGGTWIFDRAGWCPGMATDVNVFPIENVSPGETIEVDYGVNGSFMSEANYLVNNQLVTYGDWNFQNDASLEYIMRPNNRQVEFERINPACSTPMVQIRNTGGNTINTLEIEYNVKGGTVLTYTFEGSIAPNQTEEITLPVDAMTFWETDLDESVFEANILSVNGSSDEQGDNDYLSTTFTPAKVFDYEDPIEFILNTNNVPQDNSYTIRDSEGNVVMARDNLTANTTYQDAVELPAGCYTFDFVDTGDDGLSFWFFPNNGNGNIRFNRLVNGNIPLSIQNFNADFGGGVQFDFVMPMTVNTEDLETYRLLSIFPNPTAGELNVELHGFENEVLQMELTDVTGKILLSQRLANQGVNQHIEKISLDSYPSGMYFLKVTNGEKNWVRQVVKE